MSKSSLDSLSDGLPGPMRAGTVAVIIPYYNGSKYIRRSVSSVLSQTILPDEFVVVDDGSSEEEAKALDLIAVEMGFQVLRKDNGGQGSARNHGVTNTTSRFICFLDQDDFFLKNHIAILLDGVPADDPHFGWVYGDLMEADGDGNIIRSEMVQHHASHPKQFINDLIANDMFILPSASLINREAFESVGGFDVQFTGYEDDDLFLRIFRNGYTNYFVPKSVTVWCINSDSTSYSIRMSRSRLRYCKKLCSMFPDEEDQQRFYVRDLINPRFRKIIFTDAFRAVAYSRTAQQKKMTVHRDELVKIMNEYVEVINNNARLSLHSRISMSIQARILRKKSKNIALASLYSLYAYRYVRKTIKVVFR